MKHVDHSSSMSINNFVRGITYAPTLQQIRNGAGVPAQFTDKAIQEFCELEGIKFNPDQKGENWILEKITRTKQP